MTQKTPKELRLEEVKEIVSRMTFHRPIPTDISPLFTTLEERKKNISRLKQAGIELKYH